MKYIFLTFSGYSLPIAARLIDEGNEVIIGQIKNPESLKVDGWQGKREAPEEHRRRLSLYGGILEKTDADYLLRKMRFMADRKISDYFVISDHNNLCEYSEKILGMGFTGFLPTREDYERERNRKMAHQFVKTHYKDIHILESEMLAKAADGIALVEASDDLWVLKSNGNLGETIVPKVRDVGLNHQQIIGALTHDAADYEKGGFLLEKKILDPIEFTPEIAFWNGEPIYCQVEIECKPMGAGDTGPDGGGAINLVVRADLEDPLYDICFPPVVFEMARNKKGLFIFDAGVLFDPKSKAYFFTEFAGNRWSWGGVFSELAMSMSRGRFASAYFEKVAAGMDPLTYRFGATVSLYNILQDKKTPGLSAQDIPVYWNDATKELFAPYQIRKQDDIIVNVGCGDSLFGYVSGYGNTLDGCVRRVYSAIDGVSLKEILYRPKSDYLSAGYPSAIMNRLEFLRSNQLIRVSDWEVNID